MGETDTCTLQNQPTGFEEYYVDAPITPQEYAEGREIYDVYVTTATPRDE
jgi:hypothetical protein